MRFKWPSWLTWYKKPEYRDIKEYATNVSTGRRPMSPDGRSNPGIPSRLRLDRILANKTCTCGRCVAMFHRTAGWLGAGLGLTQIVLLFDRQPDVLVRLLHVSQVH